MKRLATILGLAIIALVSIYLVAAALGVLSVYHIPTPAMEPTVKVGEYVISTNVIKYKRGDLVSFLYPLSDYNEYYLKRLCALPGDKVEMKEGVLFVNNVNFDQDLNLYHAYIVTKDQFETLKERNEISDFEMEQLIFQNYNHNNETLIVNINDQVANDLGLKKIKIIDPNLAKDVVGQGDKNNFGPITVPNGQLLMLGDNRDNSLDSRFWGYCPIENLKGVVVGTF